MQCCPAVMYVVVHNAIVIFECDKLFGPLFMSITSCPDDMWVGLSLLSWFMNKHYRNFIASSAFWLALFPGSPAKRGRAWYILSHAWLQGWTLLNNVGWTKLGTHAHWRTSIFKTAPVFFSGQYGFSVLPSSLQSVIYCCPCRTSPFLESMAATWTTATLIFLPFSPSGAMSDTLRINCTGLACDLWLM